MPKNLKGGKKAKMLRNNDSIEKHREIPVPTKEDDSHVAVITKVFGDSRYFCTILNIDNNGQTEFPVSLSAGVKRKYGRGMIVGVNTYILMAIREFQKDKGDIIFIYKDSELPFLISEHYIPSTDLNTVSGNVEEPLFDFDNI